MDFNAASAFIPFRMPAQKEVTSSARKAFSLSLTVSTNRIAIEMARAISTNSSALTLRKSAAHNTRSAARKGRAASAPWGT